MVGNYIINRGKTFTLVLKDPSNSRVWATVETSTDKYFYDFCAACAQKYMKLTGRRTVFIWKLGVPTKCSWNEAVFIGSLVLGSWSVLLKQALLTASWNFLRSLLCFQLHYCVTDKSFVSMCDVFGVFTTIHDAWGVNWLILLKPTNRSSEYYWGKCDGTFTLQLRRLIYCGHTLFKEETTSG